MTKPFYTVPGPAALKREADDVQSGHRRGDDAVVETLQHLPRFADASADDVLSARVSRRDARQALARVYGRDDWDDLLLLADDLERDDLAQIRNRARFLRDDHAARKPIAAVRLRKALPDFAGLSDPDVFARKVTMRETQRVLAREYGFERWSELAAHIEAQRANDGFLSARGALPPRVAALMRAVDAGDATCVAALLAENVCLVHARVSSDITCGDTLLHRADPRATNGRPMTRGHLTVAQLLIDHGIDINAMGGRGDSCFTAPLDASTWIGNTAMVRLLLRNGADPNRCYWDMPVPVDTAASHNGRDAFRMLVAAGADYELHDTIRLGFHKLTRELATADPACINRRSREHMPLCLAAGDIRFLRLLLRHGADINVRDQFGYTPLMRALEADERPAVDELLARGVELDIFGALGTSDEAAVADLVRQDPACVHPRNGQVPLIWAVRTGDWRLVARLLDAGADVNATDDAWASGSPLTAATSLQNDHLIPPLIEAGAEVNPDADRWQMPLTAALRWGTHRAVQLLLDAGADPNAHEPDALTVLSWPAYIGDMRGAQQMLDGGASAQARSRAVIVAAQHAKPAIVELLAANGGDVAMPDIEGTALERAQQRGDQDTIDLLREWHELRGGPARQRERTMKSRAAFLHAVLDDDAAALRRMLRADPTLTVRTVVREHVFQYAVGIWQTHADRATLAAAADVLVDFGVPWTVPTAAAAGRIAELERLLDADADGSEWAVLLAAKMDRTDVLDFLLDRGFSLEARQTGGALHEAVQFGSLDAVRWLLEHGANPNAADRSGRRPLQRNRRTRTGARMRDLLLTHGARR